MVITPTQICRFGPLSDLRSEAHVAEPEYAMNPTLVTGLVGLVLSLTTLAFGRRRLARLRPLHVGWAWRLSVLAYSWPVFGVLTAVGLLKL